MSKLTVRMNVTGYIDIEVDVDVNENDMETTIDTAKQKAGEIFSDTDFGKLTDIDGDVIRIEDENDNTIF